VRFVDDDQSVNYYATYTAYNGFAILPEIIRHGETGYIVADIDGAVEAVDTVRSIDRSACRKHVELRFSHTRMAADYARVYQEILV